MTTFKRSLCIVFILTAFVLLCGFISVPAIPSESINPISNFQWVCKFVNENWSSLFLILSELAALLPGPWNGILQAIFRGLSKQVRKNSKKT